MCHLNLHVYTLGSVHGYHSSIPFELFQYAVHGEDTKIKHVFLRQKFSSLDKYTGPTDLLSCIQY